MSERLHIEKLSDSDPRALRGFALVAARMGDQDSARVLNAAAAQIESLTHLIEGAVFHFFGCGAGIYHEDECGQLVPSMADLAKAIKYQSDPGTDEEIDAVPMSSALAARRALPPSEKGEPS